MIRHATKDDIPACLELGRLFFEASGYAAETEYDPATTAATLTHLIESPDGLVLVADTGEKIVGLAGAMAYPHYFNAESKAAQELFWWVQPEARGGLTGVRLLQGIESWARDQGCRTLTMICLTIDSPAERVYQRTGYRASERNYIKRL